MGILRAIWGVPNKLLRGLAENLLIRWLRDGEAGKHGALLERVLGALKGWKSWTGLTIGLVGYVGGAVGASPGLEASLEWIGGFLLAIGLSDKAISTPGRPAILAESPVYRWLADNSGTLASILTALFVYVSGSSCVALAVRSLSLSCAGQGRVLLFVAAAASYLGILDAGFLSKTPGAVRYRMGK